MSLDINTIENVYVLKTSTKTKCKVMHGNDSAVYPHDKMFGRYCTLEEYIDCPPKKFLNIQWILQPGRVDLQHAQFR